MPAPWTAPARRSLDLAADEARALGHGTVLTGHLLAAFLAEPCAAGRALAGLGLTLESARASLREITPPDSVPPQDSRLPLSAVLRELTRDQADFEAATLGHREISTMHLLLAIATATEDSTAIKVLARHGLSPRQVRDAVLNGPRSETAGTAVRHV